MPGTESSRWDSLYKRQRSGGILQRINAEAMGDPELAALGCNGFLTRGDLPHFRAILEKCFFPPWTHDKGRTLLDLGCGRGGLGRWLARELNCRLIGIDSSRVAIDEARAMTAIEPEASRPELQVADLAATNLEDKSVAAIV